MKKNTRIYIVAFLILGIALGWLCYSGFQDGSVYFLNVSEAHASTPDKLAQARLFGVVSPDGLQHSAGALSFLLQDKDNSSQTIPVVYRGVIPDTFKAGAEVIVEGGLKENGSFAAHNLMTKCPSKYQKQNRQS